MRIPDEMSLMSGKLPAPEISERRETHNRRNCMEVFRGVKRTIQLDALNPQQRAAVRMAEGPLLLLAGAGTGKTRVITYRVAHLISAGAAPECILAVTFTNKAARELKERLARLLSAEDARKVTACTFHSFGVRLLRAKIRLLGYGVNFDIASEGYQVGLVRTILGELGMTNGPLRDRDALHCISLAKSRLLEPGDIDPEDRSWPDALPEIYRRYQTRLKAMNMVDFDDLLLLVIELWGRFPEVLEEHRQRFRHLLVDEYQDTNAIQFQLLASLAGEHRNICAVGDDDQSIYGWRGADVGNILRFENCFPGARVVRLEQNYRSTNTILEAANAVIAHNRGRHAKRLWSRNQTGEKICVVRVEDDAAEARFVADAVSDFRAQHGNRGGRFAVFYRSNHQARPFEDAFRRAAIPYQIVGARSFYESKEILDTISFLRVAQNPRDDISLLRILNVPPRGIGDKALTRLSDLGRITGLPLQQLLTSGRYLGELPAATAQSVRAFHDRVVEARQQFQQPGHLARATENYLHAIGYLDGLGKLYKPRENALRRRENVYEFINKAAEFDARHTGQATLENLLEEFTLLDDNDKVNENSSESAVTMMTVHAAKGLEFPAVFVCGMEHGLFPHHRSIQDNDLEEERRLFYVAMTRAQEELILVHAEKRRLRGSLTVRRRSSFLDEIPDHLKTECTPNEALRPATPEMADDFLAQMKAKFRPD